MPPLLCAGPFLAAPHSVFTIIGDLAASAVFHCRRHLLSLSSSDFFGDVFIVALSS